MRAPGRILLISLGSLLVLFWWATERSQPRILPAANKSSAPVAASSPVRASPSPIQPLYQVGTVTVSGQPPSFNSGKTPAKADTVNRWASTVTVVAAAHIASLQVGDNVLLPLMDGRSVTGRVNLVLRDPSGILQIGGSLTNDDGGTFALGVDQGHVSALILPKADSSAYVLTQTQDGHDYLLEKPAEAIVCLNLPPFDQGLAPQAQAETTGSAPANASAVIPMLSSRPTAPTVIYLDFDGESVTDPKWNGGATITAKESGFIAEQILETWQRVAEDYRPFNIDVTTNLARYNAVAPRYRMRCIITGDDWYYTFTKTHAGGVAYVNSWNYAGTDTTSSTIPCWVFVGNLFNSARNAAEAASHEIGHTLGLSHDGLKNATGTTIKPYYAGRGYGPTSWAPIMGVGYYTQLVQFSKGEYSDGANVADNTEDDLAIITTTKRTSNHVAYMTDDADDTFANAKALTFTSPITINTIGLIEKPGDADTYKFTTSGGYYSFQLVTADYRLIGLQNADVSAVLYNGAGETVLSSDPADSLTPSITINLPAGTYYLKIVSVGEGTPQNGVYASGYSPYGSIGGYQISADVSLTPIITSATTDTATLVAYYEYQTVANNLPYYYATSALPDGLYFNSTTGLISGVPLVSGTFKITLSAINNGGSGNATLTLTIQPSFVPWLSDRGLTGSNVLATADPDGDGITNLLEYAFDLNPLAPDTAGLPVSDLVTIDDDTYVRLTFTLPAGRDALRYQAQLSTDLTLWQDGHAYGYSAYNYWPLPTVEMADTLRTDGTRVIQLRSVQSVTDQPATFLRVKVTSP